MMATTIAKLPTTSEKRNAELARRFGAVGLVLHGVDVYKQGHPVTRYALRFTDPEREEVATMRAERGPGWEYHTMYADGVDDLNDLTADPLMLAYIAWLVRMRAYERPLDRKHGVKRSPDRWGHERTPDAPRDVLNDAEQAYQRSALNLARFECGIGASGDDAATLARNLADMTAQLKVAADRVKARDRNAEQIHPRPVDPAPYDRTKDYNREASYRAAQERKYRHERHQH